MGEFIVIGLRQAEWGRDCPFHAVCGSLVREGSLICFKEKHDIVKGKRERVVGVYFCLDGILTCHVGFLSRRVAMSESYKKYLGWTGRIVELWDTSKDRMKRKCSHMNCGAVGFVFLDGKCVFAFFSYRSNFDHFFAYCLCSEPFLIQGMREMKRKEHQGRLKPTMYLQKVGCWLF